MRHATFSSVSVVLVVCLGLSALPARAVQMSSEEQVVAMVHRVQDSFKKDGLASTIAAVNDKASAAFHERDLYAFIYDMQGICLANGARPALVGKNLISLKDQDGKYLIQEMIDIAAGPGSGWVSYKWPSPVTNKIEDRSAFIEKMGDYFVGVGMDR
jgi:signal transduction histidine kinase